MALSKIARESAREEVKLDMTSMIDVTFLLLIFFIVTMKFRVEEGKLEAKLPENVGQSRGGPPVDREKVRVRINLTHCNISALKLLNESRKSVGDFYGNQPYVPADTDFDLVFSVGNVPVLKLKQVTRIGDHKQPESRVTLFTAAGQEVRDSAVLIEALKRQLGAFPVGEREATALIIDPDRSATYHALTLALQAAEKAGFKTIQFAGKIAAS